MTFFADSTQTATPIKLLLCKSEAMAAFSKASAAHRTWLAANRFGDGRKGTYLLPAADGEIAQVWQIADKQTLDLWALADLPAKLLEGTYSVQASQLDQNRATLLAIGWGLGHYRANKISKGASPTNWLPPRHLVAPKGADQKLAEAAIEGIALGRNLINLPANILTPDALESQARALADQYQASLAVTTGKALKSGFPAIHAVGASVHTDPTRAPRLIDLRWGQTGPKITLVGKGVTFDTGGLDLKPAAGMINMKKDMGGAAYVLGLARMIMGLSLPMQLRVIIPCVENSVSDMAFRPGDVIGTRKGLTIEIGNTDAEGRLILADALELACDEQPELVFDFATLTGAARVAMGADVPAFFANQPALGRKLQDSTEAMQDLAWQMPLHQPYAKQLKSHMADLNNIGPSGLGGAITAALFLEHFVTPNTPWLHMDTMAYNASDRPGRPKGGEMMGALGALAFLKSLV